MKIKTLRRKEGGLSRKQLFVIVLTTLLILLGTYQPVFSAVAFAVCCYIMFAESETFFLCFLFYIMPMAGIFKLRPDSSSLFTYLELLYVGWHLMRNRLKITMGELLAVFFAMYIVIAGSVFASVELTRMLKLVMNVILMGYFAQLDPEKDHYGLFLSFIYGILVSSLLRFLDSPILAISDYVMEKTERYGSEMMTRFSGLYGDPNYYSVNVIIAICLILVLYKRKEFSFAQTVALNIPLVIFVGLTGSKSSFLMLVLPLLLIMYVCAKNRNYYALGICILAILAIIGMVITGQIELFELVLYRLNKGSGLVSLTTGRTEIWKSYFNFFKEEPLRTIFGSGGMILLHGEYAPHNTYIDLIFQFGLVGTALYLSTVTSAVRKNWRRIRRNMINGSIWLVVAVMYLFLSELQSYDMTFHVALACIVWNLKNEKVQGCVN